MRSRVSRRWFVIPRPRETSKREAERGGGPGEGHVVFHLDAAAGLVLELDLHVPPAEAQAIANILKGNGLVLMVDLLDGDSERPVWRGLASEVMGLPDLEKVRKKVDKVTRKMFKSFPPD